MLLTWEVRLAWHGFLASVTVASSKQGWQWRLVSGHCMTSWISLQDSSPHNLRFVWEKGVQNKEHWDMGTWMWPSTNLYMWRPRKEMAVCTVYWFHMTCSKFLTAIYGLKHPGSLFSMLLYQPKYSLNCRSFHHEPLPRSYQTELSL